MKIIKSFRNTTVLNVDTNGEIIVKTPRFVSEKKVLDFIEKHKSWIEKRQNEILSSKKNFVEGEKFLYLGNEYPLFFDDESRKIFFDGEKFLLDKKYSGKIKEKLLEFYKFEANDYIKNRTKFVAKVNNLEYNTIKIMSGKSRLGCCNTSKNLIFSFRIMLAPRESIDYIISHELAHLRQMNHSKKFWKEVGIISQNIGINDYRIWKKWLKENSRKINFI